MGLRLQIGKALAYGAVVLALALPMFAQPTTTTVADTLYAAFAGPTYCTGSVTISWTDFYSKDGFLIKAGSLQSTVGAMGALSVGLVPTNTNVTPATGIYRIQYNLQPTGCSATSEAWNVPSSMSPVSLNDVRALPVPPPSLIPLPSLAPPIIPGTYQVCYVNGIVQWTMCSGAGSVISGSGTAGKLAKFTASTVIGNAAVGDITSNFSGCSGSQYLGFDGACHTPISQLTSAAIIGLWTGCSGVQYLGADGACHSVSAGTGTVTSVALTVPSWLGVAGSPVTTSGTLAVTPATGQTSHLFIGTCGTATTFTPCSIVGGDLPNPSSTTLGGIESFAAVTHQWIRQISTSGVPTASQPACADLSDGAAGCSATALPPNGSAGGDLSGTYPNPTVAKVNGGAVPTTQNGIATDGAGKLIAQTAAKVVAEFSGCSGVQYLGADGACHAASGGSSQWALGQTQFASGNTVNSVTFQNNVTSGNIITVGMGWDCGSVSGSPTVPTDSVSTTYTTLVFFNDGLGNGHDCTVIWKGAAGGSGSDTISITVPTGGAFNGIFAAEWLGGTVTADGTGSGTSLSTTQYQTVRATVGTAGDLVLSVIGGQTSSGGALCAGATPLTAAATVGGGIMCYKIANSAGLTSNAAYHPSVAGGASLGALKSQ